MTPDTTNFATKLNTNLHGLHQTDNWNSNFHNLKLMLKQRFIFALKEKLKQ